MTDETVTTTTWKVYDYAIVDPSGRALYLGEVEATTFDEAAALVRETYPAAYLPYIFNDGDEKGFI